MTRFVLLGFAMAVMTLKIPPIKQLSSSDSFLDMSLYFVIIWKNNSEVNASLLKTSKVSHSNLNSITKIHAQLIHILQQLSSIICALRDLHTPCILYNSAPHPCPQSSNFQQIYYSCKAKVQEMQLETLREKEKVKRDVPSTIHEGQNEAEFSNPKGLGIQVNFSACQFFSFVKWQKDYFCIYLTGLFVLLMFS